MKTSIYDISNDFTGDLAAKLIAGSNDNEGNQDAYQVVLKLLQDAYKASIKYYELVGLKDDLDKWRTRNPLDVGAIQSAKMQECERILQIDPKGGTFKAWLVSSEFEYQTFERDELQRWLDAKGMVSAYRFAGVKHDDTTPATQAVTVKDVGASDGVNPGKPNKTEKTLIFEAKVLELMGKFWNERTPGTEPTKNDLCKLVYDEILRTPVRGARKTTRGMVTDAAKPWKFPVVLNRFVPDSKFNEKRHPFKGDK